MVEALHPNFFELGVLVVGIVIALQQLRDIKETRETELETRQAQFFMQIYSRFDDLDWMTNWAQVVRQWEWKDYEDWYSKYSPDMDIKDAAHYGSVAAYFEGIGVLVYKKLIDIDIVADLMSRNVTIFWEKMGPIIKERRIRYDNQYVWEWNEWLYNEIKKRQLRRKPAYLLSTSQQMASPTHYHFIPTLIL